jgi:hypothetical protein
MQMHGLRIKHKTLKKVCHCLKELQTFIHRCSPLSHEGLWQNRTECPRAICP